MSGLSVENVPAVALALSGGGTKAGLTTAGAVYGLDGRESSGSSTAGLLQGMTYISALSGGSAARAQAPNDTVLCKSEIAYSIGVTPLYLPAAV